jgi:hypothetical protein
MKKLTYLLMLMLGIFSVTSCSDDDDEVNPVENAVNVLPGTYEGYTVANATYFQNMVAEDQKVSIAKNADATYTVTYTSDTWGTFTISPVVATYVSGKYVLAGEGSTQMGMNGNVKEYACTLTGEVDVEKTAPSFLFTVPSVMGGMTIQFYPGVYAE